MEGEAGHICSFGKWGAWKCPKDRTGKRSRGRAGGAEQWVRAPFFQRLELGPLPQESGPELGVEALGPGWDDRGISLAGLMDGVGGLSHWKCSVGNSLARAG